MEIVLPEPALASAEEAFAYLTALKSIMIYGGISDCDMEKGQLRWATRTSRSGRPEPRPFWDQGGAEEPQFHLLCAQGRHRP